jgi:diguanylate cyclase (GGDEF)-like protein
MKRLFVNDTESLTTFGFGLVLALSLSVVFIVLWQLDKWNSETFELIKEVNLEAEYTHKMRDAVRLREISIQHMLNSNDIFDRDEEHLKFLSYGAQFAQAREELSRMQMTAEIQVLHDRLKDAVNYSKPYHEKLIELIIHSKASAQELRAIAIEGAKATQQIVILLDRLVQLQYDRHAQVMLGYEKSYNKVGILSAAIYAASLIIAVFVVRLSSSRYKYVSRLSIIDEVTNSYNRRYFDMVIEEEWKRSMREYTPISLVMVDIDYFKSYNDKFGHPMGDICLFSVAKIMGSQLKRSSDFIARYGGEEFVVVLPNTNAENARIMAERLRRSVEEARIQAANDSISSWVTVSVGVVTTTAEYEQRSSVLVKAADQALYKSKHDGRNRVTEMNLSNID